MDKYTLLPGVSLLFLIQYHRIMLSICTFFILRKSISTSRDLDVNNFKTTNVAIVTCAIYSNHHLSNKHMVQE